VVDKDVVHVSRVIQDGVWIRVSAGASSFRREERLEELLEHARRHVEQLRQEVDSPEHAALSARQRAARKHAAAEKQQRLEQAIAQLPELQQKQAEAARHAGRGKRGEQTRARHIRVSPPMPKRGFERPDAAPGRGVD